MSRQFRQRMAAMQSNSAPDLPESNEERETQSGSDEGWPTTEEASPSSPTPDDNDIDDYRPSSETFIPTPADIAVIRALFVRGVTPSNISIPPEVTNLILDAAEYWPCVARRVHKSTLSYSAHSMGGKMAVLLCLGGPIPHPPDGLAVNVKKAVFRVSGRDQGWVSSGASKRRTYHGAYSWYEAAIYRPRKADREEPGKADAQGDDETVPANSVPNKLTEEDLPKKPIEGIAIADSSVKEKGYRRLPKTWPVQRNLVACRAYVDHEVVWCQGQQEEEKDRDVDGSECGVGFVEKLQPGDYVGLWGLAQVSTTFSISEDDLADRYSSLVGQILRLKCLSRSTTRHE
jgi:hypothetical protein